MKPADIQDIQERFVEVEGCRLRYLSGGSGPAIVFIHGLFGYSFSWRFNLPVLAQARTVYALDLPGAGFSERIAGKDLSFRGLAKTVVEFLKALNIVDATIVGSSHGAGVAIQASVMAQEYPVKILSLVLVSPVNPSSRNGRIRLALAETRAGGALFRLIAPCILPFHDYFVRRMYGDVNRMAPGTCEGYAQPIALPASAAQLVGRVRHWKRDVEETAAMLPALASLPVLIVWGGRDCAVDPGSARALVERLPNARLVVLPTSGHLPFEEQPDEFNRILIEFLQEHDRNTPPAVR